MWVTAIFVVSEKGEKVKKRFGVARIVRKQ